jgi:hypothetical protein
MRCANEYPRQRSCRKRLNLKLTQQDLADLIGASRETTNIALNDFEVNEKLMNESHSCFRKLERFEELENRP